MPGFQLSKKRPGIPEKFNSKALRSSSIITQTNVHPIDQKKASSSHNGKLPDPEYNYQIALVFITLVAFISRFYSLDYPDEVVFDEVHFGKFASYYLERTYFFDLHPPFGKLLIAAMGWLVGYDGSYKFTNIGDNYVTHNAPFMAYRLLSAIQSTLTIPVIFLTLKASNYRALSCLFASMLVLFDNAHVAEARLILLDATLNLSVALSIYSYVKFSKERRNPFSLNWWKWLIFTGISLSFVISTKYVGVFTFFTIGIAVFIDLWDILDIKKGHSLEYFATHFIARFFGLVFFPFLIYLGWFWVHFAVLSKSGPGNAFMSPEFQETLADSPFARDAKEVYYYDTVTIKHQGTKAFLHSHLAYYPMRYEDGRISSQGQQVTALTGKELDSGNYWQILPDRDFLPEFSQNQPVLLSEIVRFYHPATESFLITHDVASPYYPTNEEFTTVSKDEALGSKYNFTLFKLEAADKKRGARVKTRVSLFKALHVSTSVAIWTHDDKVLPEWGYRQQEVNGNKKFSDTGNLWYFNNIVGMKQSDPRLVYVPKEIKQMSFIKKWLELQRLMFYHNNRLTSEHPFASSPKTWPFSLNGVSFWTKNQTRQQIYFIGNILGFWIEVLFIVVYLSLLVVDQLTSRRSYRLLSTPSRKRLHYNLGFFFIGWAAHYFPFFLMSRQKFLHHYLPAHLIAAELSGAVFEFVFSDNSGDDLLSEKEKALKLKGAGKGVIKVKKASYALGFLVLSSTVMWCFFFFAPLTYGNISLTVDQVVGRKWLDMTLHFAK